MTTIEKINKIVQAQADKAYGQLPQPQREHFSLCFARGFKSALEILGKMPWDTAIGLIGDYHTEMKRMYEEQLKMIDAYNLSMMPEEEYIRQLRENGADIDEYMRLHHPEKTKGHGNRTTD